MNNKIIKKSVITFLILIFVWLLFQGGCKVYWYIMAWSMGSPENYSKVVDTFRALPSETVIKKLHTIDMSSPYPQMAIKVLVERREKKAVPELIKLTKSWNEHIRRDAIWALGLINDSRAVKPLMEIVNRTRIDSISYDKKYPPYEYFEALTALSRMKYEGVYSYAVKFASSENSSRFFKGQAITMFKYFEKQESIPLLKKIAAENKEWTLHDGALDAIKHIELLQK